MSAVAGVHSFRHSVSVASRALSKDDDASAKAIAGLVRAFRKHYGAMEPPGQLRVLAIALGWSMRICRTAEAIVALHRYRFDPEASPLVRSLMEHAIKLRWLVDRHEEAIEVIEYDHRRYQRLLKESAEKGGWDLEAPEGERPPSDLEMQRPEEWANFERMPNLIRTHGDLSWYTIYRFECSTTHATYLSGAVYWDEAHVSDPGFGIRYDPQQRGATLRVVAAWLLMGLGQLSEIAKTPKAFDETLTATEELLGAEDDA